MLYHKFFFSGLFDKENCPNLTNLVENYSSFSKSSLILLVVLIVNKSKSDTYKRKF